MSVQTERVELTISVAESVVDLSMSGVQVECAAEIVGAAVASILTVAQRERRDAERARLAPGIDAPLVMDRPEQAENGA